MTACPSSAMTNRHRFFLVRPLAAIIGVLRLWKARYDRRMELTRLTARDLNDVGASWDDFAHEANKPFWRA